MEQDALMRKLMKRYERVELQYNVDNARNQLISSFKQMKKKSPKIKKSHVNNFFDTPKGEYFMDQSDDPAIKQIC